MNADQVKELLSNATPGPWYAEDGERFWQLFAQRVMPLPADAPDELRKLMPHGFEGHPMQLLKAPKTGTPYAEYWPESGDAALIAAAPAVAQWGLERDAEVARLREAVLLLLSVAQESWDQWAFHAPDGTRWEGGLSTLERLRGILGPLNLLNEDGVPVAHETLNFPYEDDDKIITAALPLLQSPE